MSDSPWLNPLRALRERGAEAIGNAYARAASSLLERAERLEDQAAERRYARRTRAAAVSGTSVAKSSPSSRPSLAQSQSHP